MHKIDTGPNPPLGHNLLKDIAEDLERRKKARILRPLVDVSNRVYGLFARSRDGLCFFLVARSTDPYRGNIVSSQSWMIKEAERNRRPIVMSIALFYHVFDPRMIMKNNLGENIRADKVPVKFLNWDINLGEEWIGPELLPTWEKVKRRSRRILLGKLDEWIGEKLAST